MTQKYLVPSKDNKTKIKNTEAFRGVEMFQKGLAAALAHLAHLCS